MSSFFELLVFAMLIFCVVFGAGLIPFASRISTQPHVLFRMTCIAAGFLISSALLIVVPEGFSLYFSSFEAEVSHAETHTLRYFELQASHSDSHRGGLAAGAAVLLGFVFMLVLESLGFGHDVHEEHHDHMEEHNHDHVNHPAEHSSSLVIGLTLHAVMDGVVLAAAFSLGELVLSLQLALIVLMHKFPAAFSLAAYSLHERKNRSRSLIDLLLFAIATPIAMVVSWALFGDSESSWQGLAVLFAAGGFIYVSAVDVLPAVHIRENSKQSLGFVLAGIGLMLVTFFLVATFFPEAASH